MAELAEPKNRWPKNDRKIEPEKTHSFILGALFSIVTGKQGLGQAFGQLGRKKTGKTTENKRNRKKTRGAELAPAGG